MIQLVLLICVVLVAVYGMRWFLSAMSAGMADQVRRGLLWAGLILGILLAVTGRLGLLVPLIGAFIAALLRFLPALIPLLVQALPFWARRRRRRTTRRRTSSGRADSSTVEATFLRMQLDHGTGEVAGEVLKGPYAGRSLNELHQSQLAELYRHYARHDRESARLLQAYVERLYGSSWEQTDESHTGPVSDDGRISRDEAYAILGLPPGASREDIVGAHRRLMQKLHPDRGGTDYLASKINRAKEVLLGR